MRDRYGSIIRGDSTRKEIALVFTAHEFGDGAAKVLGTFAETGISASFFLTGQYYAKEENAPYLDQMKKDGHYLGAHSDQHLLYCDWTNRDSLLVTKAEFSEDLERNYEKMKYRGIAKRSARYYMPSYEWYNGTIRQWTEEMGLKLINFTPGLRTAADYTYPEMGENRYWTSRRIFDQLVEFEQTNISGLNGFIVLIHLGTDPRRPDTDKFYDLLPVLIDYLTGRGYAFQRIDNLLE